MASSLYKQVVMGGLHGYVIKDGATGVTSTFTLANKPVVLGIDVVNNTATRAVSTGYVLSTGVVTIGGLTASDDIYYIVWTE